MIDHIFYSSSMTDRQRMKTFKYGVVYFIETDEVGIVKSSQISDGWHHKFKKNEYVVVEWEKKRYFVRVLEVSGEYPGNRPSPIKTV